MSIPAFTGRLLGAVRARRCQAQRWWPVRGHSTLMCRDAQFYQAGIVDEPEAAPLVSDVGVGVNLTIVSLGVDLEAYGPGTCRAKLRYRLQTKSPQSAKRLFKRCRRQDEGLATHESHRIAKTRLTEAQDARWRVAVETLQGIRWRITLHQSRRGRQLSWMFDPFHLFLKYKPQLEGILVVSVDLWNTLRTCLHCKRIP